MRVYKSDGTFTEDTNDNDFGWSFSEIAVDDGFERADQYNKETRVLTALKKYLPKHHSVEALEALLNLELAEEASEPPNLKLGLLPNSPIEKLLKEKLNFRIPSKQELAKNIKPCNPESKMLLAVVYFAKYKSLIKEEAAEDLMKNLDVKTTNFKYFLKEEPTDISEEIYKEILYYHTNKEDSMLSLMMELILKDIECNANDLVSPPEEEKAVSLPQFVVETSDLGNSIDSGTSSKGEPIRDYPQTASRSNILSSIGLDYEDRSIRCLREETCEMHHQLAEIRKSFQECDVKVNNLLKETNALRNDLRETQYLDDLINLLEGNLEKVASKKLPFRIFQQKNNPTVHASELNLII
ncbi:uncharacterized protein [Leptinotarsa decemlineata]|uniref:uncharacterized protein n=1 Tax=Leptinotarsa decemlineata TaxID=7539 RepID=UPI003D30A6DF